MLFLSWKIRSVKVAGCLIVLGYIKETNLVAYFNNFQVFFVLV